MIEGEYFLAYCLGDSVEIKYPPIGCHQSAAAAAKEAQELTDAKVVVLRCVWDGGYRWLDKARKAGL